MLHKRLLFPFILSLGLILAGLSSPAVPTHAAGPEDVPDAWTADDPPIAKIYLPVVERPKGYTGKVTYNGTPAAGQTVQMLAGKNDVYSTWATTTTDANGNYGFPRESLPPLGDGNTYYVRWANLLSSELYLRAWYCDVMTGGANDNDTCDIEISNIPLTAPNDFATVGLPVTFRWSQRVITSDRYLVEFNTSASGGTGYTWVDDGPTVGYTNQWTMSHLTDTQEDNLVYGKQYAWGVVALGPNGYGESFYLNRITFTTTGSSALAETTGEETLPGGIPRELSDAPRMIQGDE